MSETQQGKRETLRTSRRFNLISAMMAFALWGGWAWYINSESDVTDRGASPIMSGVTQGTGSFLITLVMVRAVTWLYHHLPGHRLQIVLPALLTVSVTGTCLASAHAWVGTTNIVSTIAPALTVAFLFNIYTAARIRRAEMRNREKAHNSNGVPA